MLLNKSGGKLDAICYFSNSYGLFVGIIISLSIVFIGKVDIYVSHMFISVGAC